MTKPLAPHAHTTAASTGALTWDAFQSYTWAGAADVFSVFSRRVIRAVAMLDRPAGVAFAKRADKVADAIARGEVVAADLHFCGQTLTFTARRESRARAFAEVA